VRAVVLLAIAGLLVGCGTTDPTVTTRVTSGSGNWRIDRQNDRVTGMPVSGASVYTQSSSHSGEMFPKTASVQLTCFENRPIVRIGFEVKIGSDRNSVLGYRFDDKPGRDNVESRVLLGYQVIVIEDRAAVAQFVGDLLGSNTLYLRIRSLNAGRTSAEFKVNGNEAAVQAAYADCPLAPEPKRSA
jgi:hypothetical protein